MLGEAVRDLQGRTRGEVMEPGDGGYEAARAAYNAMATGRPVVILRPADLPDIVAAVRWAAESGLAIGVRGGGHSVAGHSSPDGALLIDLSRSGTFIDTGIGGLTLTGGISWLLSSEGFACDALIGAQLVTADGDVLEVDAKREPEVLWGLRGGGGNFGIVTQLRYALTPVPAMFGGRLRFRGDALRDAILRTFEVEASAPDELVLAMVAWRAEDGSPAISVNVGWRGDPEGGTAAIRALTDHPACYETDLKAMSWLQQQSLYQPIPFGLRQYWKGHLVSRLDESLADALLTSASEETNESFALVELIHGRAHRIPESWAAFGGRAAMANVTALAIWSDPADDEAEIAWARRFADRVSPLSLRGGGYLNYPELDQTAARVAAAYPPDSWARLQQLKRRLDPANRFRFNANIPPADA
jgi:FAD/FMN-containing dehydrogenase